MLQRVLIGLGCLIFIVSGGAWLYHTHNDPRQVFEAMLVNNLKTTGYVDQISQGNEAQDEQDTVEFVTGPLYTAHAQTVLKQGLVNPDIVKKESIGTPYLDFLRFVSIETTQKSASGKPLDFSHVVNTWGKAATAPGVKQTTGQLYNQAMLGVVPFGNLSAADRKELIQLIHDQKVYQVDYSSVVKQTVHGRPVYTYKVNLLPKAYVLMLKSFGSSVGLTQLKNINPEDEQYATAQPIPFTFKVDAWSRQLVEVDYAGGARKEVIRSFGLQKPVALPTQTIPLDDIQTRLQSVQ